MTGVGQASWPVSAFFNNPLESALALCKSGSRVLAVTKARMEMSQGRPERGFLGFLRAIALIAVLAGAMGSAGLMLHAGRRNDSRILLALFVLWVLFPFMALLWANMVSKRWTVHTRATLYSLMLVLTLCSLANYGKVALGPPRAKPAFVFVVVPAASWLPIAIVVPIAALISGRRSRRADGA
jgi:hypothetical protein